jgi:hypothetical protein
MFCCTTLRDVIFAEWYFVNVISTTGILQHAVVCRVTTDEYDAHKVIIIVANTADQGFPQYQHPHHTSLTNAKRQAPDMAKEEQKGQGGPTTRRVTSISTSPTRPRK